MPPEIKADPPTHHLPRWLADEIVTLQGLLSPASKQKFDEFLAEYSCIVEICTKIPKQSKLYEMYKLDHLSNAILFQNIYAAYAHIAESLVSYWAFQHAHKFKASFSGFKYGIDEGNFLLALSCARAMFEELAHFHYYLIRTEASSKRALYLYKREEGRIRKGKQPTYEWKRSFFEARYELIERLLRSRQGSDYDWNGLYKSMLRDHGMSELEIENWLQKRKNSRKTHINDGIESIVKAKKFNAEHVYDLLSELVHPNFGSNTLVVVTRDKIDDVRGNVILSDAPKNVEAAAWIFELAAEPLKDIFSLERDCLERSQKLVKFYQAEALQYQFVITQGGAQPGRP